MNKIKVGQVYSVFIDDKLFIWIVTYITNEKVYVIFNDGKSFTTSDNSLLSRSILIAEYPSWSEAVSKEFTGN